MTNPSERTRQRGFAKTQPGDPPTARQREVLGVITKYIADNGYAPTVRELGELIGCSSPNGVTCHLRALQKKGLLTWTEGKNRTIRVLKQEG